MGLNERRAAKAFQDTKFPALKAALDAAAGFPLELEVAWDTLTHEGSSALYDEGWTKVYFTPLATALGAVGVDAMGKEAMKASLKRVVIRDEGSSWPEFEGGVLTLKYPALSNLDDGSERAKTIQETLEKGL
jgi:hypothetical protein